MKQKRRSGWLTAAAVLGIVTVSAVIMFRLYIADYYRADAQALEAINAPAGGVTVTEEADGTYAFIPAAGTETGRGLIFYPGGKVEYTAYAPLMEKLAQRGITCVLLKVRDNLAILDIDAADGVQEKYPEISEWYLGGHSLGGAVASMYLAGHADDYEGLILLGAYAQSDLSKTGLRVISLYGENDGVMNRDKYESSRGKLPADFTEKVIPGGCHAYFGSYGAQDGDGTPAITPDEQQEYAAEVIAEWMETVK